MLVRSFLDFSSHRHWLQPLFPQQNPFGIFLQMAKGPGIALEQRCLPGIFSGVSPRVCPL